VHTLNPTLEEQLSCLIPPNHFKDHIKDENTEELQNISIMEDEDESFYTKVLHDCCIE
jgi:hypothetical protein